jgi:hypothetical protein
MPSALELAERTPPGMAHYAGTGPEGTRCGDCHYLEADWHFGGTASGYCQRYRQLLEAIGVEPGDYRIASATASCRHYVFHHRKRS